MANLDEIQIEISAASAEAIQSIDSLISSLENLKKKTDLAKPAEEIKGLSDSVEKLSKTTGKFNAADFISKFQGFSKTTMGALKGIAGWGVSLTVMGKQLANSVGLASRYTQTVNMLNSVMGEGADEAKEFAEELGNVMGLNPADVMNFQATFQNLFIGFGNNSKQAQIMSKNLTQLSYDMAAFYEQLGGDPQAAAEKLRLAMAGTIEPIQRLGYAIKEADLQAVAARQGINVNVRNLNTASKSMLRYIAVMEQSTHVQGFMAKSFSSPTTAMMVFKSAVKQLSTEIGKTFLPMLMAAIPYMQAFITGVLNMVKTINKILGIELPTIEGWDDTKEGISSVGDEAEQVGKQMKKAFTLGIDELNVLDNAADGAGSGFQDITGQLKLPEYDMLEGFSGDKLTEIQDKLAPLQPLFDGLALAFAGFYSAISGFVDSTLYPWLVSIGEWMKNNPETVQNLGKFLGGVALGLLAIKAVGALGKLLMIPQLIDGLKSVNTWLGKNKLSWWNLAGIALAAYGAFLLVTSIIDIIRGKGDFADNIMKGLAGIFIMLTAYIVGKAIPLALTNFAAFAAKGGIIFAGLGKAASIAMLGIAAVAGLALAYILLNWDEASYQIQQAFAKFAIWINDKFTWLLVKAVEIIGGIRKALVSVRYAITKGVAKVFGWILEKAGALIDKIVEKIGVGLGLIDKLFGTDLKAKLEESYVSLEGAATQFKQDLLAGLDQAEIDAKAQIDFEVQLDTEMWEGVNEDAKAYWNGYMATSQRMYDEALAEKAKQEEEERKKQEEQAAKEMEEMTKSIQETLTNIEMPAMEMPEMDTSFMQQTEGTEEVITNTANTNTILGETKELQTTANELMANANAMQTDFNSTSLTNDTEMAQTLVAANNIQRATTNDILSLMKTMSSSILSALRDVEKACRNIKIEVHKHYGGGDGYATGGYPTSGEYFFAREDGLPEMVGRVGRQTAVMNNGQIADTMAQSLVKALGQGGASQQPTVIENKLYLDGEVVYNNQQKIQRSKGYNLGMGVFANV